MEIQTTELHQLGPFFIQQIVVVHDHHFRASNELKNSN